MGTFPAHSHDKDWKNPQFISAWKADRRRTYEQKWEEQYKPLFDGVSLAVRRDESLASALAYAEKTLWHEGESFAERARRLEGQESRGRNRSRRSTYSVHNAIGKDDSGEFVIVGWARRATAISQECAKYLYEIGLEKKAQRRIACTVLWAERHCPSWHFWKVAYQCGNRYCQNCGPRRSRQMQCQATADLTPVAHDIRSKNRSAVIASIDFTWPNSGKMPDAREIRVFNYCIKKCFRILARRFGFTRKDYGAMFCNEFGAKNTNLHAHGVYVGPWIPQTKRNKQLSKAWAEATSGYAFIASIKVRSELVGAIAHALKYPAKYIESSTPERLAVLEHAFHGVKRVHKLGRFYNVKKQESEDQLDFCSCPICKAPLSDIVEWVPLEHLSRRALDLEQYLLCQQKIRAGPVTVTGAGPPGA